ncbi:MAG: hypothetical protein PHV34_22670 [Verrucomicrobiae bacterium]|nr:hypothetical protein [Verrucomicrobiae bacterium]
MIAINSGNEIFDSFSARVAGFLEQDISEFQVGDKRIRGYRSPDTTPIWLRDHTHQLKAFKYFEKDLQSAVTHFLEQQLPDGSIYDFVDREGKRHRAPCEADVEYLLVEAVYTIWQATGDDDWLRRALPRLERALCYSMSHPARWSKQHQLVKRPFTIDTWDFVYNPNGVCRWGSYGEIDANTSFCIMHGDNTGMFQACAQLAKLARYLGHVDYADYWASKALHFKQRLNEVCWNGRFFTHQVHIDPIEVNGVEEKSQLSLSNAYALNRGVLTPAQCASIIEEYRRRRQEAKNEYFAEWFSIHPAFPDYSFHAKAYRGWLINRGWYVNGGVMPLVGGELAKGAFENGFEDYGLDILMRYYRMIAESGKTYLWYHPNGEPGVSSGSTLATDGWGSAAMLSAYIEGLVGVKDEFKLLKRVRLAPRWAITEEKRINVKIGYDGVPFTYEYLRNDHSIQISWEGPAEELDFHILLPAGFDRVETFLDGGMIRVERSQIRESRYVDFTVNKTKGLVKLCPTTNQ